MNSLNHPRSSVPSSFAGATTVRSLVNPHAAILLVLLFATMCRADQHALIVVGAPGSPMYQRHYDDRVKRFQIVLNKAGITDVVFVSNKPAAEVLDAVQKVSAASNSNEQFVIILL